MDKWEQLYELLGIREFIYFISSPMLQAKLLPVKLVFIAFTLFFFCAVIYFYIKSSYLRQQFLQDTAEFLSWQPYGLTAINKRWKQIIKKTEFGFDNEYKLALIDADDFLYQVLEERGFKGETFEELVASAGKKVLPNLDLILQAHEVRNSIVYNQDYRFDMEQAKKIISEYESAVKSIATT